MSTSITFTVDENFTQNDLRLVVAYSDMAVAIWNVKQYLRDTVKHGRFVDKEISASEAAHQIREAICEIFADLPDIG